jgi:hypothetical protein
VASLHSEDPGRPPLLAMVEATGQIPAASCMPKAPFWRDKMKAALTVLPLSMSVSATAQTADATYKQACGPLDARFVVEQVKGQSPTVPEPGKALVFSIQKGNIPYFTTTVGLDGAWAGVLQHDSYIFVPVGPGEHHACAATLNRKRPEAELVNFTVAVGSTYYYLLRGIAAYASSGAMEFGPADRDEARYLIASDPQSLATPAS